MNIEIMTRLNEDARSGIKLIIDLLLPGEGNLPRASEVNAHEDMLDRVLNADTTLEPLVRRAGEWAQGRTAVSFSDIAKFMGEDMERLVFALHAAYYMGDTVRQNLQYPGQRRLPIALATPDQVCSDELIAPVEARGKIYVPTPA